MKIVSDNSELLEDILNQLKIEGIVVKSETRPSKDTDMSGEVEIFRLALEVGGAIYTIKQIIKDVLALYNGEHIYVETKDGEKISFEKYSEMSDDELSKYIF